MRPVPRGLPACPTMPDSVTAGTVGKRLVRRLESAPKPLPGGIVVAGATPGGRGRGVNFHLAPSPYRALGEGGRSRHGPSGPCATTDRATGLQDVAAPPDRQERGCASPDDQSVNRPLASFAHSNTGLSRALPVAWPIQRASRQRGWRQNVGPADAWPSVSPKPERRLIPPAPASMDTGTSAVEV